MERGRLGSELRESAALLRAETWLFVGVGLAWVAYGGWVIATGLLLGTLGLDGTVFSTGVSVRTAVAVGLWFVGPALVSVVLVNRQLRNRHGNLIDAYRLDHPSLLLAIPGSVLLGCLLLSVVLGQRPALTLLALVGTVHLVIRTVAYGHRVYTLSLLPLLSLLVFVSAVSLGISWLVQATTAPGVSSALSPWIADAGVDSVAEPLRQLTGSSRAVPVFIAVPGVLASVYLVLQSLAGAVVRARAPLANPQRRPDQRFPIMPPVGGPRDDAETAVVEDDSDAEPEAPDQHEAGADSADDDSDDSPPTHTGTRVFSPDEMAQTQPTAHDSESGEGRSQDDAGPEPTAAETGTEPETPTAGEDDADSASTDEEWIDDTAVFTPGGRDSDKSYCGNCGASLAGEVTTCPSCGESITGETQE